MAGVVSLWNNWEVHVLVVVSFLLQVFLLCFAGMRRRNISIVARTLLWLSYLLADSIAIYILGHMSFSSKYHQHQQLMAFWAPFLLVHLGGQDTITAYSIEDSKLWPRQLLDFAVQALGVAYVLYKYIAGSWTLVTAAVLIYVSGVFKYGERIMALKFSSMDNMSKLVDKMRWKEADDQNERNNDRSARWDKVKKLGPEEVLQGAHDLLPICMAQFVDYKFWPSPSQCKVIKLLFEAKGCMYEVIEMQLSLMHDILYTKSMVVHTRWGCFIRAITAVSIITTFFIFQSKVGKNGFNIIDVIVTYILIVGALVLEMAAFVNAMGSTWTCAWFCARRWERLHSIAVSIRMCIKATKRNRRWSGSIGKPRLSYGTGPSRGWIRSTLRWIGWEDLHRSVVSDRIKELVLEEVCRMVKACEGKEEIMRGYSGQCALNALGTTFKDPTSHAGVDFDDKVIAWYFATEMFLSRPSHVEARQQDDTVEAMKALSGYMVFLLVERPYMLPSPVRPGLYANTEAAYVSLRGKKDLIDHIRESVRTKEMLDRISKDLDSRWEMVKSKDCPEQHELYELYSERSELDTRWREMTATYGAPPPTGLARGAELARMLLDLEAQRGKEVRRVVLGVWVELLSYAGHHCSRDSHARQLGNGGEFTTIVWLLSTAVFNSFYCDEPLFKRAREEFFKPPYIEPEDTWLDTLLWSCGFPRTLSHVIS